MNIIEALQFANDKLKSLGGQDSSMLDAQILLSAAMGLSKTKLVTTLNQTLTQEQKERFESLVARRLKHEPVAYLIGRKEFFKRLFIVTPEVLIPRPDTEVLIEEALANIQDAIRVYVESLAQDEIEIPKDLQTHDFVTTARVEVSVPIRSL